MLRAVGIGIGLALLSLNPNTWVAKPTAKPESVSSIQVGVWWRGQPNIGPSLPPPSTVPSGGMWVSSTTAGTVAESALKFTVGPNDRQPIVNVPINSSTTLPGQLPIATPVQVVACQATSDWKPPAAGTFGPLSVAPTYDCAKAQVLGSATIDGKTMVFDFGGFVTDTNKTVSAVLVPLASPPPVPAPPVALPVALPAVLVPPTFDITFNPISSSAVAVLTTEPAPESTDVSGANADEPASIGDSTIPSYSGSSTTPAASAPATTPTSGVAAIPRQLAQVASKAVPVNLASHERAAAAAVFVLLCLWAWIVSNQDPIPGVKQAGRPYRTIYDGPSLIGQRRFSAENRRGKAPSLL